jgi:hypothetical protein
VRRPRITWAFGRGQAGEAGRRICRRVEPAGGCSLVESRDAGGDGPRGCGLPSRRAGLRGVAPKQSRRLAAVQCLSPSRNQPYALTADGILSAQPRVERKRRARPSLSSPTRQGTPPAAGPRASLRAAPTPCRADAFAASAAEPALCAVQYYPSRSPRPFDNPSCHSLIIVRMNVHSHILLCGKTDGASQHAATAGPSG